MKYLVVFVSVLMNFSAVSQDVSLALQKKPNTDPATRAVKWSAVPAQTLVSFAGSDTRFSQLLPPEITQTSEWKTTAWKGEKVHTQIVLWAKKKIDRVSIQVNDLKDNKGNTIPKDNITSGFLEYVITDEFRNGCGHRKPTDFDSSLVADIINTKMTLAKLDKNTTLPIWLSVTIPATAKAGQYTGNVTVNAGTKFQLKVVVEVSNRTLPSPDKWKYQLDLWQHPAAVARVHDVPLWSDAHFAAMKQYYTMLASAGQKIITASIVNEPWGHQTYDDYPSLVKWTKKTNGTWTFDYSLFDKYVSFVMSCGIKGRINCYSMVPWKIAFTYYDEALQKEAVFTEGIGTPGYNAFWTPMLKDFTAHLKAKNWFGITAIAMDERPMPAMQSVIQLLKTIDANWKISLAGNYHPEIENDIFDYCIASNLRFPDDVLQKRNQQGKASTWYTCCVEKYPNGFTFSPPDEHVWMGWYTAATQMDGYLRWAFNSWTEKPLVDSRFRAWPAGDTYQVYPGPLSSIRFEKLIEGIQDFEKINLLKDEYTKNNETDKLKELEATLQAFTIGKLATVTAAEMVANAKHVISK